MQPDLSVAFGLWFLEAALTPSCFLFCCSYSYSTPMKHCAFCLKPAKMTGEHIWSRWIGELFSDTPSFRAERSAVGKTTRWRSLSIDAQANVVCARCNNTWMSDVEREAQTSMSDMIRFGSIMSILPLGIASIATFAFSKAVIVDHTVPDRKHPFFPYHQRTRFAKSLKIPIGVQVWLSAYRSPGHVEGGYSALYGKFDDGDFRGFEFYTFTYLAGFLVFQLTGFRWDSIAKRPKRTPYFVQSNQWDAHSLPIWPPTSRAVRWPPRLYLTGDTIEGFSNRFFSPLRSFA